MSSQAKALTKTQRSHNLYVFSNAVAGQEDAFLSWFKGEHLQTVSALDKVLAAQHFVQNEKDITNGISKPTGYTYLSIYELSLDGAEQAGALIDQISSLHDCQVAAGDTAFWLYYPVSEKVGCSAHTKLDFLVLAFGNAVKGKEAQFREWYSTEHIRHALILPTMVSGQRFELSIYQQPGATAPSYDSLAVYEQEGTLEELVEGFLALKPGDIEGNPSFDLEHFSEWAYFPITKSLPYRR